MSASLRWTRCSPKSAQARRVPPRCDAFASRSARSPRIPRRPGCVNLTARLVSICPTVPRVDGFHLIIFFNDHPPPHVHARKGGGMVVIALVSGGRPQVVREVHGMSQADRRNSAHRRIDDLCCKGPFVFRRSGEVFLFSVSSMLPNADKPAKDRNRPLRRRIWRSSALEPWVATREDRSDGTLTSSLILLELA